FGMFFFFSSRRRHTRWPRDWSSDVCSSDLCGFNTPRVSKGIGYFGGYNEPPTCFGVLIADVSNPADMKALNFIPCNPGTRCNYKIGRASCRERGKIWGVARDVKKKRK